MPRHQGSEGAPPVSVPVRYSPGSGPAQTSRTHPRSQRCAGSPSKRGCQSKETVNGAMGTGSAKLCMPAYRTPVCRSWTQATKSEARTSASAAAKPPTVVAIGRCRPMPAKASSMGPLSLSRRDTWTCLAAVSTSTNADVPGARFDQAGRGTVEDLPQRP